MENYHSTVARETLIPWSQFRKKYRLSEATLDTSGLTWQEFEQIYLAHLESMECLEAFACRMSESLEPLPEVYCVRNRVKDPEHLVGKILRKNCENRIRRGEVGTGGLGSQPRITLENFPDEVTDLVGIRVVTLLKEDRQAVHDELVRAWQPFERVCNYRRGDPRENLVFLKDQGFRLREHPDGYRAWHYLVEGCPGGRKFTAEIQVRTLFEEAWSEIDHRVRYPGNLGNPLVNRYLRVMNRLAGAADSMGSLILYLNQAARISRRPDSEIHERYKRVEKQLHGVGLDAVHNFCSKCGEPLLARLPTPTCSDCFGLLESASTGLSQSIEN